MIIAPLIGLSISYCILYKNSVCDIIKICVIADSFYFTNNR